MHDEPANANQDLAPPPVSSLRLILTMAVSGTVAGLLLASVFLYTRPAILANQDAALRAAVLRVLPGAVDASPFARVDGKLVPVTAPPGTPSDHPKAFAGRDGAGKLVGYALPAEGAGFMDTIKVLHGFDPARRRVVGLEVMDSRETPGLGDKILTDKAFLGSFHDLAVDPAAVGVKRGTKDLPHEVDCISGATISSKAVVKIVNRSVQDWSAVWPAPAATPGTAP